MADGLIVLLPEQAGGAWHAWRVDGGVVGAAETAIADGFDGEVLALIPSAPCPARRAERTDMAPRQAETVAAMQSMASSLGGPDASHAVARIDADNTLWTARVDRGWFGAQLALLAEVGLERAQVMPAALVLPKADTGHVVTAHLGGQPLCRTAEAAFADDPAVTPLLTTGLTSHALDDEALRRALGAAFADPPLNLRSGAFALPRRRWSADSRWGQIARMAAIAALLGLAIMLAQIARLHWAASSAEDQAIADAQRLFPAVADLPAAETAVQAELARRGLGAQVFTVPTAALFAAMQGNANVKLRSMNFGTGGVLSFEAAAPRPEDINQILLTLQSRGYVVTVPPALAADSTGATVAQITLRAP